MIVTRIEFTLKSLVGLLLLVSGVVADEVGNGVDHSGGSASGERQVGEEQSAAGIDEQQAVSLLATYCYDCHAGGGAEGGIEVDFFEQDISIGERVDVVEKMIRVLNEQQMPPADYEQPSATERVRLTEWISGALERFDCGSVSRPGRVTMRRLNRVEYDNTIRDLTGLELGLAQNFPSDDVGNGFDNQGEVLTIPPILMEKYLDAAVEIAGAVLADERARQKVFPHQPADPENLEEVVEVARRNARQFAMRAFRRPVTASEAERLFGVMRSAWELGASEQEIMATLITAVLTSPHFIYRVEQADESEYVDGQRRLNDYEIASRLSYFLWSSMPDERLMQLAAEGNLHSDSQLKAEVKRMLADPKSVALVNNFAGQWLQLRDLERLNPDEVTYPEFDMALRKAMRRETELLFEHIMRKDLPLLDLLAADYSFINQRLAEHYGMTGSDDLQLKGQQFQLVSLGGQRRGVLMHASVLTLTSNPTRTSPVKRGKWVLDNLLGEPPPPPPPDVPELGESAETLGTLRQQMEQHRANPNCAVCHTKMDALGFGLENFDGIGKWRDRAGRQPIDPAGTLPGGREFAGPVDLVQILAEDKPTEFARCVTRKMLAYALGRGLGVYDRCTVNTIVEQLAGEDYRFHTLVEAIVTSPPFLYQELGR